MNWTDEYREIIEFYYWEPQHLGRASGPRKFSGAAEMWEHVNKLEVSLNHILSIFFSLYDVNKFAKVLRLPKDLTFISSKQLSEWQAEMKDFTQPDLFFEGFTGNLAIELKLGAKVDAQQIAKYITFNTYVSKAEKPLHLIILSPHETIDNVSKEQYQSIEAAINDLQDFVPGKAFETYCTYEQYLAALEDLTIQTLSFDQFIGILKNLPTESDVEAKLVEGILDYFEARNLSERSA